MHLRNGSKTTGSKLTEVKGKMDDLAIVGDFNVPFSTMDRPITQKVNKETEYLSNTIQQLDLIDMYGTL